MEAASAGQERFERYAAILGLLLEVEVESRALRDLQAVVRSSNVAAEEELGRLGRRVAWAEVRHSSMAHAPLQAALAWDVHALRGLEQWKARSGRHVRDWLEALGELEALCALATLRGDHPEWCLPKVTESHEPDSEARGPVLSAKATGHPLLPPAVCVRNDVEIGPPGSFLFVTGSNMSGKSTLLRAVGLNTVLAQAGGPVCAERMELPSLRVQTSMRTADSLAEGVSQYMAELKRIRGVVEAAREEEGAAVLFLLDEPLQGTNEAERRVAVQTILGHLLDAGAVGAVATHDLGLDETPRLKPAARAVHLEGNVREGETGPLLTFDYLLKPGRATSTNALALLRAVGLGEGSRASR
jgi:DNA mismatch repair ATPase MutS